MNLDDGKELIKLAKDSIKSYFENKHFSPNQEIQERFETKQGIFVTLHKNKKLRGCIGFIEPIFPLYSAVIKAAQSAAFSDTRFPSLSEEELSEIEIEVSVLTIPELIDEPKEKIPKHINIGKDGLIVEKAPYKGLLLPQVFIEYPTTQEGALEMTCTKAGLDPDDWKNKLTKVYKFQAVVFSEEAGEIIQKSQIEEEN